MLRAAPILLLGLTPAAVSAEPTPRASGQTAPPEATSASVVELPPLVVNAAPLDPLGVSPPAAVATHDGDFVSRNRIDTVSALAPFVPGFFASEQAIVNPSYGIRGITTDNVDPRSEERVSVYQDGVPISRTSGASVALFDLERVDVHKGPEPTRFGRNVQAGAVSLVSNPARNEKSAGTSLSVGDYATRSFDAFVNTPVVAEKLFVRVAVHATEHEGYVDNLAPGAPSLQDAETSALRASLRWQPAESTTLDVAFNLQRDTPGGTAFKSMDVPTSSGDTDPFSAAELNRGGALGSERSIESLSATLRAKLSPEWKLTSTTAGRQFDMHEEYDGDGSRFYLFELGTDHRSEQLGQEIRLDFDSGEKLTATLGAGAFLEKGRQHIIIRTDERRAWSVLSGPFRQGLIDAGLPSALANAGVPPLDPFAPDSALPGTLPPEFANFALPFLPAELQALSALAGAPLDARHTEGYFTDNEYRSIDLFGNVDYRLTERLSVGGGLRLTAESIESGYDNPDSGAGTIGFILTDGSTNNVYRPTAGRLASTDDNIGWSGRVHARYELTKTHEAFAAVSRGRRPPSLGHDRSTLAPVRLDEETVVNYETGLRGAVASGRAGYSVSAFQYYYDGFQTNVVTAPGVVSPADGGRARGQGVDATVNGTVNRRLALFASYGFTDARFSALDEDGAPQAYAGNTFRLASRHAVSLGGTAAIPAFDRGAFYLSPVWQYRSEAFFEDDNARSGGRLRQGGYGLVNLTLAYRPARGFWEAALYADNLLDRDYLIDAGNLGAAFGLPTTVRGNPRVIGARFTARF